MSLELTHQTDPSLPRLGWIARLERRTGAVHVTHGTTVEAGHDFVVEGAWDGDFQTMAFHRAEHFFGSGVRVVGDEVHFVPSCAIVDRLLFCEDDAELLVSNSLAVLLARSGARLIPGRTYISELYAPTLGVTRYDERMPVEHGRFPEVRQLYYRNLVWSRSGVRRVMKAHPREIDSFEGYVGLLRAALRRLDSNLRSPARRHSATVVATISRGYDSPAACVLGRDMIEMCYTRRRSNSAIPAFLSSNAAVDDGSPIAQRLGLPVRPLEGPLHDELWYLAGGVEPEVAFARLAQEAAERPGVTAVMTAYNGSLWNTRYALSDVAGDLIRRDISGLSLSEIRLRSGFFMLVVPFLYSRSVASIDAISLSPEMAPYRVGGLYDKPIPRRILEEAGIPRGLFGTRKKAIVSIPSLPFGREHRSRFLRYVREVGGRGWLAIAAIERLHRWSFPLRALPAKLTGRKTPRTLPTAIRDLPGMLYTWAVNALADHYAPAEPVSTVEVLEMKPPAAADPRPAAALVRG
jgi:hypothetical protein